MKASFNDGFFVSVKFTEHSNDIPVPISSDHRGLGQIAKICHCVNRNNDIRIGSISNDNNNVPLHIMLGPATDLLQGGDPRFEMSEASDSRQGRETEIKFCSSQSLFAPLDIMVPELAMSMM
jgi:hypothetical protein